MGDILFQRSTAKLLFFTIKIIKIHIKPHYDNAL